MDNYRAKIFLADCLYESIEDENYSNTRKMLEDYNADCNVIIPGREVAAIHYAAGMDNTLFAENVMKLMLKNGGNPNVRTTDGETPIHIAAFWNRKLIIEMLLDHGGDLTLKDNDGRTAISNAITEKHYDLIPIFQNYVFEDKMQKRIQNRTQKNSNHSSPSILQLTSTIRRLEIPPVDNVGSLRCDKMLTPNKTNFNFDEASPFLINITHRRKPNRSKEQNDIDSSELSRTISVDRNIVDDKGTFIIEEANPNSANVLISSDEDDDVIVVQENLFQLTQSNLELHLRSTPKQNRVSLVNMWRNKVNKSRPRESILPADTMELDSFILKHTASFGTLSASKMSTPVSNSSSVVTVVPVKQNTDEELPNRDDMAMAQSVGTDSFVTAIDENGGVTLVERNEAANGLLNVNSTPQIIRSPDANKIILQMEEAYMHTDTENNIVFYEQKLLANPALRKSYKSNNADESVVASESCPETEYTIPLDYDTDELRRELTQFGDAPGPITKTTKRLYMKRLVKYKRKPAETVHSNKATLNFTVELMKTLRAENTSVLQEIINDYGYLERQMIEGFHLCPTKRFREGNLKTSFIYLLIDPRISENLPGESQLISKHISWQRFIPSIFYVGKGKSSRPYAHLYDAIKIYQDKRKNMSTKFHDSLKLERITDIWQSGKGVICLPVFHNIMPVEAYTREASIIDCIGIENLTNIKRGDYYGISKSWTMRQRKQLGVSLLYKAMHIFMAEGESQLRPDDIQHRK